MMYEKQLVRIHIKLKKCYELELQLGNEFKLMQSLTIHVCVSSSQSEREEFETEYKQKYERERVLLTEENKKLSTELDKVKHTCSCIHTSSNKQNTLSQASPFSIFVALYLPFSILFSQLLV